MEAILFFNISQEIHKSKHNRMDVHCKPLHVKISEIVVKHANVGVGNGSKREATNQSTVNKITHKLSLS